MANREKINARTEEMLMDLIQLLHFRQLRGDVMMKLGFPLTPRFLLGQPRPDMISEEKTNEDRANTMLRAICGRLAEKEQERGETYSETEIINEVFRAASKMKIEKRAFRLDFKEKNNGIQ